MKFKIVCILCLSCSFLYHVSGKDPIKKTDTQPEPVNSLQTQLMNEQISKLMADHKDLYKGFVYKELASLNDFIREEDLLEFESLIFPADELYGFWETSRVNPYRNQEIAYPDTFSVDCTSFILPIDVNIKVTSNFGIRGRQMHNGIDLKVQKGDTIRSAFSGKIRIAGYERRGYGYYLVIRHSNGLETLYGHLSKFLVSENEIVKAGQPIGLGGNTGRSTGTHLHFETRFLGQALNPSHIIDFNNGGTPHNDQYVLYKENFGKNVNIYTSTSERIVYHRIQKGETLGKIALQYKTTVSELCRLNGLTTKSILRVGQTIRCGTTIAKTDNKDTEVTIPNTATNDSLQNKEEIKINDTNIITASTSGIVNKEEAEILPDNAENISEHHVKQGESLFSISKLYKTSIEDLCRLNGITTKNVLRIGQIIRYNGSLPAFAKVTSTTNTTQNEVAQPVYYRVKEGDTLGAIALKHGISLNQLCELNNITRTTILRIGRSLRCS